MIKIFFYAVLLIFIVSLQVPAFAETTLNLGCEMKVLRPTGNPDSQEELLLEKDTRVNLVQNQNSDLEVLFAGDDIMDVYFYQVAFMGRYFREGNKNKLHIGIFSLQGARLREGATYWQAPEAHPLFGYSAVPFAEATFDVKQGKEYRLNIERFIGQSGYAGVTRLICR